MARTPDGAPGTTARVGRKLSTDVRRQARPGVGRDRPPRRTRRSMPCACTSRPFDRLARTASSRTRALAHEVAARFYAARGFETIAHAYLRNARYCYLRWGALGKVRQLEQLSPAAPRGSTPAACHRHCSARPSSSWTSATVVKASQAVSGEIVLDRAHRDADDDRARTGRRRARPAHPPPGRRRRGSRRRPGPTGRRSRSRSDRRR